MSETAKVIRFYKTGGSNVLKIDEVQLSQLKEQEVLVRVQALAVSRPDLLWRQGSYFEEPEFPAQIGYDAAGIVESIGPEVKTLKVGDRFHIPGRLVIGLRSAWRDRHISRDRTDRISGEPDSRAGGCG